MTIPVVPSVSRPTQGSYHMSGGTFNATPTTMVTPTFNRTAGPSSGVTQGMVVRRNEGLVSSPLRDVAKVSSTLVSNTPTNSIPWQFSDVPYGYIVEVPEVCSDSVHTAPQEHVFTIPRIQRIVNPTAGLSSGVARMNLGLVSANPQDNAFSLGSPPFGRRTSTPRRSPSTFSVPPQQPATVGERSPHTSRMDIDDPSPGRASTPPPPAATSFNLGSPPALGRSNRPHSNEPLVSPTSPTPIGAGRQRQRPRPSHMSGQEIPQMLGEMRDVIGNLAASVNGLKDAVSDLRAEQRTAGSSGQTSTRQSGGRRGSGRGRGFGSQRGGGRGQNESTGGFFGDNYVADDEGQGDEDHGEPKNYKLRVSVVLLTFDAIHG